VKKMGLSAKFLRDVQNVVVFRFFATMIWEKQSVEVVVSFWRSLIWPTEQNGELSL
jgi:hypothetical protein